MSTISVKRSPTDLDVKRSTAGSMMAGSRAGSMLIEGGVTLREGWLKKKTHNGRWQKRWFFLLADGKLCYYHDKPSSWKKREPPIEALNMKNVERVVGTAPGEFDIVYKSLPGQPIVVYSLKAEESKSYKEATEWADLLTKTLLAEAEAVAAATASKGRPLGASAAWPAGIRNPLDKRDSLIHDYTYGFPNIAVNISGVKMGLPDKPLSLLDNLVTLASAVSAVGDKETAKAVRYSAFEVKTPELVHGQLAVQLNKLGVSLKMPRDHKFMAAVRCMHSDLLVPAISELSSLASPYRFQAVEGSWRVRYVIGNKNSVKVEHTLWEEARPSSEHYFRFQWQLTLHFTSSFTVCKGQSLQITDFTYTKDEEGSSGKAAPPSTVKKQQQTAIRNTFKPLFSPTLEYAAIMAREIGDLPVHKDVPRLVRGMHVMNSSGTLFQGYAEPDASEVELLYKCLVAVAQTANDTAAEHFLESNFLTFLPEETGHGLLAPGLMSLLQDASLVGSPMLLVLKAVHQDIIAPAVIALRMKLYTDLPFQDVPNSWRVCIRKEKDGIHVNHSKWEQSKDTGEGFFKFEWMLDMPLDSADALQCINANVFIMNYSFGAETSELWKNKVSSLLKTVMPPGRPYTLMLRRIGAKEELLAKKDLRDRMASIAVDECESCRVFMEEHEVLSSSVVPPPHSPR